MDGRTRVLVVDDDADIRNLLSRYLEGQGFSTDLAANRSEAEQKVAAGGIDLVVLDVMLTDGSGLDLCRELKDRRPDLAIILLTALKEDVDRIVGLELGADDYLGKPFNPRELAARIRAASRRVTDEAGQDLDLTGAEFDLLVIFLDRPGRVLSRDTLLDLLHGRSFTDPFDRTIDVTMSRLRRKFGDGGVFRLFKTVRNGGYQFSTQVERLS